jgi:Fe-S-cluster-containing hydrogenase component 2
MAFPSARPCEKRSAVKAIQVESVFVAAGYDTCISCGWCVDTCQHQAIQVVSRMAVNDFHRAAEYGAVGQRQIA